MAHFAQLDENGTVIQVLVVGNDDLDNLPFPESEPLGIAFLTNLFPGTVWKQTSYNKSFRANYASIGGSYSVLHNVFLDIKPFDNWVLDESVYVWVPPVPRPNDGGSYQWNQESMQWIINKVPVTVIGE